MAVLTFFAVLLLFALPLNEATRITPLLHVSFTFLDIVVGVGSIFWLAKSMLRKRIPQTLQANMFGATIVVFVLSLLINIPTLSVSHLIVSALYIVRWFCYGVLFFIVSASSKRGKKWIGEFLLIGGIFLLLIGYVQYFFYPALRNLFYAGWDEDYYRMFATFFDPNFFGLFLVFFFLFVTSFLLRLSWQKERASFLLYSLLGAFIFFAILLTYSRTALVALFIGCIVLFWQKRTWKWMVSFFVAALLMIMFVYTLGTTRMKVNSLFRTISSDARIGSAKNALLIFADNPIFGVGFNAYRYAQYRHHFMSGSNRQEDHGASGSDVSLLFVLATSGVVGLSVYFLFLWSHLRQLFRLKNRLGLATFFAWIIGSFFINGLFYPSLLIWVWIVLGITESDVQ